MSILIKGMEMPVTCCHCPLMGYDPDREWFDSIARTGAHICVLTGELIDNTKREEHCPLVPIPPHGRLGDLDKLEQMFSDIDHAPYSGFDGSEPFYSAEDAAQIIRLAPTIIPVEEG